MSRYNVKDLESQLHEDEGKRLHAYQDSLGYWTIGYGRLIDQRKGGGITNEEALYLLKNDIKKVDFQVRKSLPWVTKLSDARRGVLMNMAFQMGIEGLLAFKNTLRLIESENWGAATIAMLNSKWATQTPDRAKRLAEQIRTGEWQ